MMVRTVVVVIAALLLPAGPASPQVYRWEEDGTLYFSNEPERAPGTPPSIVTLPDADAVDSDPQPAPAEPVANSRALTRIAFSPGTPIVVSARVSDSSASISLILDTGADRTVIAPQALWRLGISTLNAPRAEIKGVTGAGQAEIVQLSSVQVGAARVGPLPVVVHDADLRQADGLLGRDFLEHFTVTIDAREQVVTLAPK
jgi:hypothetical protein